MGVENEVKTTRLKTKRLDKQLAEHRELVHSSHKKVLSHVQRDTPEWWVNTLMIEGCDAPFKYKRQQKYQNMQGAYVDLTYYPDIEKVAGIDIEVMHVVKINRS